MPLYVNYKRYFYILTSSTAKLESGSGQIIMIWTMNTGVQQISSTFSQNAKVTLEDFASVKNIRNTIDMQK